MQRTVRVGHERYRTSQAVQGTGLRYSLVAQRAKIFALQTIPQARTQLPLPGTPEQREPRFAKP
jgi:hypothetical protein